MDLSKASEIWSTHDDIVDNLCNCLGISGAEDENGLWTLSYCGKVIDWDDYVEYMFETPIICDDKVLNGILIFGDETIEIVEKGVDEPYNWIDCTLEQLIAINNYLCNTKNG